MKISIITATYNSEKTLKDTLESVLKQTYTDYEHIIIDGKSKDSTMQIVKEYEPRYQGKLKYISEKDNGLYDAMNKGIEMATGDVIGLLNSDDYYIDENVLNKISKSFQENCDGIFANIIMLEDKDFKLPERKLISGFGNYHFGWLPLHPTLYLKKEVYNEIGFYNQKYKIAADYDFMIRLLKNKKYKLNYQNEFFVCMRPGGASTNGIKGRLISTKDAYHVLKDNNEKFPLFTTCCKFTISVFKAFKSLIESKIKKQ